MIKACRFISLLFLALLTVVFIDNRKSFFLQNNIDITKLSINDYDFLSKYKQNKVVLIKDAYQKQLLYNQKPVSSAELSPSQQQVAFSYFIEPGGSADKIALMIFDLHNGKFKQVYQTNFGSWDITSDLHWLGDKYIFFLRHCGTACQGITLLDIKSGKTKNAVLTYPSFPDQQARTYFKDWHGQEFVMDGFVRSINSEMSARSYYLIFTMEDHQGNFLGKKRVDI